MKKYWGVLIAVAVLALAGCPTPTDPSGPGGPDTRATLSALVLDEGYLTPEFSPAINDYTVNVDSGVASITIAATPAQSEAVIVSGTGNVALALGENVAEIVVQHSDGTTRTYTITVTRLQPG
ncbi:MAG: cadherin-like beta sandwich domain-containing protein, partial [Spirochaetales bacterium]